MHTNIWFWILFVVFMIGLTFVLSAPTFFAEAITERFELQPTFRLQDVTYVSINGLKLTKEQAAEFIEKFNDVIILTQNYNHQEHLGNPIHIEIQKGKKTYQFSAHLSDNNYITFLRHKKKKNIPYKGKSEHLTQWLRLSYL